MNIFLNLIKSVISSIVLFFVRIALFNGELTPYFILVILCGVIIGLLITIYRKLIEIIKGNSGQVEVEWKKTIQYRLTIVS